MNTILLLIKKDLIRDLKRPWGIIVLLSIPILMTLLMSAVFGGGGNIEDKITLHVAVLDHDDDFLSGVLRSVASQGDSGENLVLHFVDDVDEGILLLENREVSALIELPKNITPAIDKHRNFWKRGVVFCTISCACGMDLVPL